jgi:hypothetical protein
MQRYQFELTDEKAEQLRQLMADCGVSSNKELFSNAITLLMWAVRETRKGLMVGALNDKEHAFKEFLLPALDNARDLRDREHALS